MTLERDAVTEFEGVVYTHRVLMHTAEHFLELATTAEEGGGHHHRLGATLFAWFAFEAYLNFVLEHLDEASFEQTKYEGAKEKLGRILERLKIHQLPTEAESNHGTLMRLLGLRHQIVHAQRIEYSGVKRHYRSDEPPAMRSEWVEAQTTLPHVTNYVAAVHAFSEWLHSVVEPKFQDPYMCDSAFNGVLQARVFTTQARR